MKLITSTLGLIFLILLLSLAAYLIQTQFFLESDVIYLLHASQKLLQGGSYSQNFFETNPPMILYLYFPALCLSYFFKIKIIIALRVYVIALSLAAIATSDYCLKQLKFTLKQRTIFLLGIAFILLFLPFCEFGQKDHLFLILTLPYWLTAVMRAEKISIPYFYAILIGLAAGVGIALKPFFLVPFVLVELYLLLKSRRLFVSIRPESLMISFVLISYFISTFILQPDYWQIIWPLVSHYYFSGVAEPWQVMLERTPSLFCFVILLLSPFFYRLSKFKNLAAVLIILLAGLIIAFMVPQTSWYCHVVPAFGIACLLGFLLCLEMPSVWSKIAFLAAFLSAPLYFGYTLLHSEFAVRHNPAISELMKVLEQKPVAKVYCIPTHHVCSLLSEYSNAQSISKFPSLWALRGLVKQADAPQAVKDRKFFINQLAQDIHHAQPDFIIFDSQWHIGIMYQGKDYATYFSQDLLFKQEWKSYLLLKTIGPYEIYKKSV